MNDYPKTMDDVNKKIYNNFDLSNYEDFQIAHVEISRERGIIILCRFNSVRELENDNHEINEIEFVSITSHYNEEINTNVVLNVNHKKGAVTPSSTSHEESKAHGKDMICFDIHLTIQNLTDDIPNYIYKTPFNIKTNQFLHFSTNIDGKSTIIPGQMNGNGQTCQGKIIKSKKYPN